MTIFIDKNLPAFDILSAEGQDIGIQPLHNKAIKEIAILNLMPVKPSTETQLVRALSTSTVDARVSWLRLETHVSKNTSPEHISQFYQSWREVSNRRYDGLIITGAPVEDLPFDEVSYWPELQEVIDWSDNNCNSTMSICWGAMSTLKHKFGIDKEVLPQKLSGIFQQVNLSNASKFIQGIPETPITPVSRIARVNISDVKKVGHLEILLYSDRTGLSLAAENTGHGTNLYLLDHPEYEDNTLDGEYKRDSAKDGVTALLPENYYINDNPQNRPTAHWAEMRNIYGNWLNALPDSKEKSQEQKAPATFSKNLFPELHPLR